MTRSLGGPLALSLALVAGCGSPSLPDLFTNALYFPGLNETLQDGALDNGSPNGPLLGPTVQSRPLVLSPGQTGEFLLPFSGGTLSTANLWFGGLQHWEVSVPDIDTRIPNGQVSLSVSLDPGVCDSLMPQCYPITRTAQLSATGGLLGNQVAQALLLDCIDGVVKSDVGTSDGGKRDAGSGTGKPPVVHCPGYTDDLGGGDDAQPLADLGTRDLAHPADLSTKPHRDMTAPPVDAAMPLPDLAVSPIPDMKMAPAPDLSTLVILDMTISDMSVAPDLSMTLPADMEPPADASIAPPDLAPVDDLSPPPDLRPRPADMAMSPPPDLSMSIDLTVLHDLSMKAADMSVIRDMSIAPDLTSLPDLTIDQTIDLSPGIDQSTTD